MKTKNYLHMLSIVLVGAILFQACEKEDTSTLTDDEITVAEDDALAENLFDEIFGIALAAEQLIDGQIFSGTLKSAVVSDSCPNVSVDHPDSTYWPKVITIESIRTREWVEGSDKWNRWDDVYFITGETRTIELRYHHRRLVG
ncbi:MAG: hypothetical protein IIB05_08205 [Bacteroidetes bacterium]|nr:hypothetical protein [Bacteroidota bacterium]